MYLDHVSYSPPKIGVGAKTIVNETIDFLRCTLEFIPKEIEEERKAELSRLRTESEIVSITDPVHIELQEIIKLLDLPGGTIALAVDTENFLAYYHPLARLVVISRGVFQHLARRLPNFGLDHIAGILNHEKQHAAVDASKPTRNQNQSVSYISLWLNSHSHAEELRADAEGMEDMARQGFNPNAFIETLASFGLTTGRDDIAHPEGMDRIAHLKNRLVDDEHPIANTTKAIQPLKPALKNWATTPSRVYQRTEERLNDPIDTPISSNLAQAKSVADFWGRLKIQTYKRAVAKAKTLQHSAIAKQFTTTSLFYKYFDGLTRLCWPKNIANEVKTNPELKTLSRGQRLFPDQFKAKTPDLEDVSFSPIRVALDEHGVYIALKANQYRETVESIPIEEDELFRYERALATWEKEIHTAIKDQLQRLKTTKLPTEVVFAIAQFEQYFSEGKFPPNYLEEMFPMDVGTSLAESTEESLIAREAAGLRTPSRISKSSVDLNAEDAYEDFMQLVTLQVCNSLIEPKVIDPPGTNIMAVELTVDAESQKILAGLFAQEANITEDMAYQVTHALLNSDSSNQWRNYLANLDKEDLKTVIDALDKCHTNEWLLLSSQRPIHESFRLALQLHTEKTWVAKNIPYQVHFPISKFPSQDTPGIQALKLDAAWELYSRSYPESADELQPVSPQKLTLSLDDWRYLDAVDLPEARGDLDLICMLEYVKCHLTGAVVDPKVSKQIEKMDRIIVPHEYLYGAKKNYDFGWNSVLTFLQITPWEPVKMLRAIKKLLIDCQSYHYAIDVDVLYWMYQYCSEQTNKVDTECATCSDLLPFILNIEGIHLPADAIIDYGFESDMNHFISCIARLKQKAIKLTYKALESYRSAACDFEDFDPRPLKLLLEIVGPEDQADEVPTVRQALQLLLLTQGCIGCPVDQVMIRSIQRTVHRLGYQDVSHQLISILPPSNLRNEYLVAVGECLADGDLPDYFRTYILPYYQGSPDSAESKVGFEYYAFSRAKRDDPHLLESFYGKGKISEMFPNLLYRRFSFATRSLTYDQHEAQQIDLVITSPAQHLFGRQLLACEKEIFCSNDPFSQYQKLVEVVPQTTAVRDQYLEIIMREALQREKNVTTIANLGRMILPAFTRTTHLSDSLAVQVLRAELIINPNLFADYQQGLGIVLHYMPLASLARNYFLDLLEEKAPVTPSDLAHLRKLRISPEGQTQIGENSPWALFISKLGELSRNDRVKYYFWLMGIDKEKPKTIKRLESEFDGSADDIPMAFTLLTPPERITIINRLCLGSEGILDRDTNDKTREQDINKLQDQFTERIGEMCIPGDQEEKVIFRKVLRKLILRNNTAAGCRLLAKITNRVLDGSIQGRKISTAELAALGLMEIGIVGKKAAQSLAEMSWVPKPYQKALRQSQNAADVVPKRALASLANSVGLISGSKGIRIISFDKYLGAASNKQACLLTVEISDQTTGLAIGTHQVVGKFKRPSAQKTENVTDDFALAQEVLLEINQTRATPILPNQFIPGIQASVNAELDFAREVAFANKLGTSLKNTFAGTVSIPKIIFASDDIVLETLAPGVSYRDFIDSPHSSFEKKKQAQTLLYEALKQLLFSGYVHADMQPTNIFVNPPTETTTLIDLGMHLVLTATERHRVRDLLTGLVVGSNDLTQKALRKLGWPRIEKTKLKTGQFASNINTLLELLRNSNEKMPELLATVLHCLGKITLFTDQLTSNEIMQTVVRLFIDQTLKN